MVAGGSAWEKEKEKEKEKENRSPAPDRSAKRFPYGRVPVRTRCRHDGPGERQQRDPDVEPPLPPALDVAPTVTPPPAPTPLRGAVGHGPCLARRVPARAPPSAKGPSPLGAAGSQGTMPVPLRAQESASVGLRVPRRKIGTPGSSSTALTLRVSASKHMRSAPPAQGSLRTLSFTPRSSQPRALQTPLRWRPAVSLQPDPNADSAADNELTPSWDKVVVQLFKGNEGQQDTEVTVALPSGTPDPSKAQRAARLLGQLLEMVQDRPAAVTVLMELWGLMAEWGVDPRPQDPMDTRRLSS